MSKGSGETAGPRGGDRTTVTFARPVEEEEEEEERDRASAIT